MFQGLYASAAGMLTELSRQDVIANNLANVSTPGFKRSSISISNFQAELRNASESVRSASRLPTVKCLVPALSTYQDARPGVIEDTRSSTNFALEGPGAFVVQTPTGERYIRQGNFHLDDSGRLVTAQKEPVLGQNGPIVITDTDWSVDEDGSVRIKGNIVDKLRIENPATTRSASSNEVTRVMQGKLESSNVSVVEEMVSMITALRAYEANQKVIQAMDQSLDKVINQIGKNS
ncbi:MAG: flagellar hook-basal body protein [Armatimonadota bacterium]